MRIAVVQHSIVWEDAASTCARVEPMIASAVQQGARLVVLPEMFATGFSMRSVEIASTLDGVAASFLRKGAQRHGCWLGGSVALSNDGGLPTNSFLLFSPDGELHRYDKRHPFSYGREHEHYSPGGAFVTVDIDGLRTAMFVCYDLRFADDFWALAPEVDAYVVVANWPAARKEHWKALLVARAIENQAYVIAANRVGPDGNGVAHDGDSVILDPLGRPLAAASIGETVLVADVDPSEVTKVRERFPFLADRR
jgi:predicted amidohydrolase